MPEVKKQYKYKFRLLVGTHKGQDTLIEQPNGEMVSKKDGQYYVAKNPKVAYTQVPGYTGDIIETDVDLHHMFDQPGAQPKFQDITLGDGTMPQTAESIDEQIARLQRQKEELANKNGSQSTHGDLTLQSMTVEELRKMAAEEEIDLGKASKKEDIINIINSAMQLV